MMAEHRHAFRLRPGLRRGLRSEVPLPTRLVSNEEFPPLPQTAAQRQVDIYMELGSTFGQLVTTHPTACAHLLGQVIDAFGADHVLWGTDSIWYGTPQWQIEAFRRFEIPPALAEKHGYAPLTRAVKAQIFGLNAARVFRVDVNARRNEIPKDYLSRMKMAYLDEGAAPSHRWYGWVTG